MILDKLNGCNTNISNALAIYFFKKILKSKRDVFALKRKSLYIYNTLAQS